MIYVCCNLKFRQDWWAINHIFFESHQEVCPFNLTQFSPNISIINQIQKMKRNDSTKMPAHVTLESLLPRQLRTKQENTLEVETQNYSSFAKTILLKIKNTKRFVHNVIVYDQGRFKTKPSLLKFKRDPQEFQILQQVLELLKQKNHKKSKSYIKPPVAIEVTELMSDVEDIFDVGTDYKLTKATKKIEFENEESKLDIGSFQLSGSIAEKIKHSHLIEKNDDLGDGIEDYDEDEDVVADDYMLGYGDSDSEEESKDKKKPRLDQELQKVDKVFKSKYQESLIEDGDTITKKKAIPTVKGKNNRKNRK